MTPTADFPKQRETKNKYDDFYDLEFDAVLIEQSIAKQYHILPSEQEDLSYSDWSKLVSGLMNDTPLGRVIEIRSEDDVEIIKDMNSDQLAIRRKWQDFCSSQIVYTEDEMQKQAEMFEKMMASMFG